MMQSAVNTSAQSIRLSVYQLDYLTAHPLCVAGCARHLSENSSYQNVSSFLESDPALGLAVINLCRQKNISIDFENFDFSSLLKHLPRSELLKTILSLKVYDIEEAAVLSFTSSLIRRSGRRAFAAKLIAQRLGCPNISEIFIAALFADTGKFAFAQLYTKSFLMLVEESRQKKVLLSNLEKEHLGITDNIASRMLLEKWRFGTSIADTVWLCRTSVNGLTDKLPNGRIITIVQLADILSSPEHQKDPRSPAQRLSMSDADIDDIKEQVQTFAGQINELLGLEVENPKQFYFETTKQIYFNQLNVPASEDKFTEFTQKFISILNPQANSIDIAESSAKAISDCFIAQSVCVFTPDAQQPNVLLASVIDGCSSKSLVISCPQEFVLSQAAKPHLQPWLFKQIGIDSDKSYFIPIKDDAKIIAGIIFSGPMPDENLLEKITEVLGRFFAMSSKSEHEKSIAELAVDCLSQSELQAPVSVPQVSEKSDITQTAAELAAGAAHELNNPLAVISGRVQLLLQSETDETRKLILNQILEKSGDVGEIIGQLMSYARPPRPEIRTVSPFIVINNCLEKVNIRYLSEPLDIHLANIENLSDIKVDAEQIAEAIAQIIYNALESYESGNGPVQITGSERKEQNLIEIRIKDNGCGMSEETLRKAAEPFFSDKSAGRQRGMGLSLAAGFLRNNGCNLNIQSQLDKGTTVAITLPMADKSENS
jgi:signal transduction histidine kinase